MTNKNFANEIKRQQLHRTFNIILNKEQDQISEDDWRFLRKQHIEFPNYQQKYTDRQLAVFNEFNFKKKLKFDDDAPDASKSKLSTYITNLCKSKEEIELVSKMMHDLIEAKVDHRILFMLRENLIKNQQEFGFDYVSLDDFRETWMVLMNQKKYEKHPHLEERLLAI